MSSHLILINCTCMHLQVQDVSIPQYSSGTLALIRVHTEIQLTLNSNSDCKKQTIKSYDY